MIQNLMTIVTSAHPSSSKWCWSGAIRNSRLPFVSLKKPTCRITDSVMTANSPPRTTSSSSVRVMIASPAIAPPSDSEPVSPMKIFAGGGVPPQEAEARAGERGRDDREVERIADSS